MVNFHGLGSCFYYLSHPILTHNIYRPYDDGEFPWIGIVFSLPITGIWYWCTDQVCCKKLKFYMVFSDWRPSGHFECRINKNALFQTVLLVILPTGLYLPYFYKCFRKRQLYSIETSQ